ncbi:hypothetical protein [Ekhidna sp.]
MNHKKSIKEIYDENRYLYAKRTSVETKVYDPTVTKVFLDQFHAKRKTQKKIRVYLFMLSCFLTMLIVFGIAEGINKLV